MEINAEPMQCSNTNSTNSTNNTNNTNNNMLSLKNILSFLCISKEVGNIRVPSNLEQSQECTISLLTNRIFPITLLPEELIIRIISFLPANDVYVVATLNHDFHRMCTENRLWRKIARAKWCFLERVTNLDWRSYYQFHSHIHLPEATSWINVNSTGVRPTRRYQHSATAIGNKIYYIGGQETQTRRFDDIFEFNTDQLKFRKILVEGRSQPPRFARHTAIAIGKKIFIFGGFDGVSTYYELSVFDTETNTWTSPVVYGNPPRARTNHAAAAIGSNIYMFGGITRDSSGELQDLDEFYILQTDTMTWKKEESACLPKPRCGHRLQVVNGKLYLFGGGAGDAWRNKYNDIHIYDPTIGEWTKPICNGLVEVCTFSSVFVMGTFIFVFGGQLITKGEVCKHLYAFDTITNTWYTINTPGSLPDARDMASITVVGTGAYLFGGYNGSALEDMWVFKVRKQLRKLIKETKTLAVTNK